MSRFVSIALAVALACLAGDEDAQAQVELVVRVADDAAALQQAMERATSDPDALRLGDRPPLLRDVARATRLVERNGAPAPQSAFADRVFVLEYPDSSALRTGLAEWSRSSGAAYVQLNHSFALDLATGADPLRAEPYADSLGFLRLIRAPEAWEHTRGAGVRVGLLDTGLDLDHPDFAGRIWQNEGEIPGNGLDDDGNGYADDVVGYDFVDRPGAVDPGDYRDRDADPSEDGAGNEAHGTLVAGVLAAGLNGRGVAGVAPEAKLVVLRAFGRDGIAQDDDVAAAIVYAAENGVDVLNASFGRRRSTPLIEEAIRYATSRGTVVVASAGNGGGDAPHYPSDYPEVISAVWLAEDGLGLAGGLAGGAQYGPGVDLGAPASNVYTTRVPLPGDDRDDAVRRYGRVSGSSFAAPQVSGAAALLRATNPALSPASVHGVLSATAVDLGAPGWDERHGAGRLDAAAALGLPYPTLVSLSSPAMDGGTASEDVAVVGTAVAPQFRWWRVERAPVEMGEEGPDPIGPWDVLAGPATRQVRLDTLAVWATADEREGDYLIRLVVGLSNGAIVEDRRRFTIDRSAPELRVRYLGPAYADGRAGVLVELESDDFTRARLVVGEEPAVPSDDLAPKHGLFWPNEAGREGAVPVRIEATNRAGLTTSIDAGVELPRSATNSALASLQSLGVPAGYLLDRATDFDGDGLLEIVLNEYAADGWIGDTLGVYEWAGSGFRSARRLGTGFASAGFYRSRTFPRDAGDTDRDGRGELLLQVGPNTLVLEAEAAGGYPSRLLYADTTGTGSGAPFWGARLTDLDGDGRGEVLGHDLGNADGATRWRLRERRERTFEEVAVLNNPTGVSGAETANQLEDPYAVTGDFDGDGRADFVSGDADGDVVVYESCGSDCVRVAFASESRRSHAGRRLAAGDFDGDGQEAFVTFTTGFEAAESDDAPFGLLSLWRAVGDDAYEVADSIAFYGASSRHGSLLGADLDGDGVDELVVVHPPSLWVLKGRGDGLEVAFHDANAVAAVPGYRSIRMAGADFDRDGREEVALAAADGDLYLLAGVGGAAPPPPRWLAAHAAGASSLQLVWDAVGADSVQVLAGPVGGALGPVLTTTEDSVRVAADGPVDVGLVGYRAGIATSPSPLQTARPYALGRAVEAEVIGPETVRVRFSVALSERTRAGAFSLGGARPESLLLAEGGHVALLAFARLQPGAATLEWVDVRDADGAPLGAQAVSVEVPAESDRGGLLLVEWSVTGSQQVVLEFSEPLDPLFATDLSAYRLDGGGRVEAVRFDPDDPSRVEVRVTGTVLGATGRRTTLVVERMRAASGASLVLEGVAATLTAPAVDLADVFVYPNPHRAAEHADRVVVAGVPAGVEVDVLTVGGHRVRSLVEQAGAGGVEWDLRDQSGRRVGPGVYFVRIKAENGDPALIKVALIR